MQGFHYSNMYAPILFNPIYSFPAWSKSYWSVGIVPALTMFLIVSIDFSTAIFAV